MPVRGFPEKLKLSEKHRNYFICAETDIISHHITIAVSISQFSLCKFSTVKTGTFKEQKDIKQTAIRIILLIAAIFFAVFLVQKSYDQKQFRQSQKLKKLSFEKIL